MSTQTPRTAWAPQNANILSKTAAGLPDPLPSCLLTGNSQPEVATGHCQASVPPSAEEARSPQAASVCKRWVGVYRRFISAHSVPLFSRDCYPSLLMHTVSTLCKSRASAVNRRFK